jgi:hypothetical protein
MEVYGERMLEYVRTAPKSKVLLVYFNTKEQPMMIERLSMLDNNYLFTCGKKGLWTYTYKLSDLKYLIYRNQTSVQAFIGSELSPYAGGARFDVVHLGNHVTVGLKLVRGTMYLSTHTTAYMERFGEQSTYVFDIDHSRRYEVPFESIFDRKAKLIPNLEVKSGTIESAYEEQHEWLHVIERIHSIFQGGGVQQHAGYMKHQGRRYKIREGCRGGRYIQVAGSKKYINQQGGNNLEIIDPLFKAAMQFTYDRLVRKVLAHYEDHMEELEASAWYDEEGEHVVLCYDLPRIYNRRIYYLRVTDLIHDYLDSKTGETYATPISQKYDQMVHAHTEAISVV